MRFTLSRPGSLNAGARIFVLGKTETSYDSTTGLLPAEFVSVADEEPELMEDGSFAPWVNLKVRIDWGGRLGWQDETCKAEMLVPRKALHGEYGNRIAAFRWRP